MTRRRILEAALDVFADYGYEAGPVREIAERANVSESVIFHHFSTKRDLLIGALAHRTERSQELFGVDGLDGRGQLERIVELARRNALHPNEVRLYITMAADAISPSHPAHEYFESLYRRVKNLLTGSLEDLRARGQLRPGIDPPDAARRVIALWDGLQIQWLYDPDAVSIPDELRAYLGSLLHTPLTADTPAP